MVEFLDGVQVVPISWLSRDKKKCLYPVHVYNQNQYNKMVTTMSSPKESWQSWNVLKVIGSSGKIYIISNINNIIIYIIIPSLINFIILSDEFEKANKKMSECVQYNLSEVNTDYEDTQKRLRKSRARKNVFSSSEDDSNYNIKLKDDYPTPPKIQPSMAINIKFTKNLINFQNYQQKI